MCARLFLDLLSTRALTRLRFLKGRFTQKFKFCHNLPSWLKPVCFFSTAEHKRWYSEECSNFLCFKIHTVGNDMNVAFKSHSLLFQLLFNYVDFGAVQHTAHLLMFFIVCLRTHAAESDGCCIMSQFLLAPHTTFRWYAKLTVVHLFKIMSRNILLQLLLSVQLSSLIFLNELYQRNILK